MHGGRTIENGRVLVGEASDTSSTGPEPLVANDHCRTWVRTFAATAMPSRVPGRISWNLRSTVVSEGTEPNRAPPVDRCSASRQLSPPPANASAIWLRASPRTKRTHLNGRREEFGVVPSLRSAPITGKRI